ncbi:PepSY domain-containing protein [Niallia sp. NCCP-28]|uniref:PepSY domain-containing protein n=1 Tax=Niallia sp. NCCP-28 TaxID=2934712 RepID=UPI002085B1D8|nr:PepSY domain-containing protein [Niallia sp. NCCP-28]GKU84839.1 peptidase M4 [Niallia sp. NCCP-28]
MNWKSFIAGITVGIAAAYITTDAVTKSHYLSGEEVLNLAKQHFKEQMQITGSWINMQKESYNKGNQAYLVYKGGINSKNPKEHAAIEFIADSQTGNILDYYPIKI